MKQRLLIKLSGETLGSEEGGFGASKEALKKIVSQLKELLAARYQVGVVLGGGNFFRGLQGKEALSLRRSRADQIGMTATLLNGMLLSEALHSEKVDHTLLSALTSPFIESFSEEKMEEALVRSGIVLFVGGTSHPYFTTDTAAALRAVQMGASLILKATTKVDGVYNKDPRKYPEAKKYERLTYQQALDEKLQILDLTAFTLCMENKIELCIYKYSEQSFLEAVRGTKGSIVS